MRIAIDTHAIGSKLTGNERYIQNLADQLLALDKENEYYFFFTQQEAQLLWKNRAPNLRTFLVSSNPFRRLGLDFVLQLRAIRPQLFHFQYTGPLLRLTPEVVTIHDVSFERHPEFFDPGECLRLRLTVRRAARTARRVITVSQFSKEEIIHFLGVPEQKVKVIYNGVGSGFQPVDDPAGTDTRLEKYAITKPYLLVVGNICGRKNQRAAVRGFARWLSRCKDGGHRLVLVGKPGAYVKDVLAEAARLRVDGNRLMLLGFVAEEDIPYLYAGAELLLNTSLYEGFGFPVIEAMRCGLPVIVSRTSCFPEIAGDAARFVNPDDSDEIAEAIGEVLESESLRDQLIERGLRRAQFFRWDAAARETLKVYYEAVNHVSGASV